MQEPKTGSPFRNLNRRGGSLPLPPLVSVDLFNSLRPKSRSCHRQAGRFAPPPRKPYALNVSILPKRKRQEIQGFSCLFCVLESLFRQLFFCSKPSKMKRNQGTSMVSRSLRAMLSLNESSRPACICASTKKHASYCDSCFLVAKNMFFHSPF